MPSPVTGGSGMLLGGLVRGGRLAPFQLPELSVQAPVPLLFSSSRLNVGSIISKLSLLCKSNQRFRCTRPSNRRRVFLDKFCMRDEYTSMKLMQLHCIFSTCKGGLVHGNLRTRLSVHHYRSHCGHGARYYRRRDGHHPLVHSHSAHRACLLGRIEERQMSGSRHHTPKIDALFPFPSAVFVIRSLRPSPVRPRRPSARTARPARAPSHSLSHPIRPIPEPFR